MNKTFSNATERDDDRGSYRHSPFASVLAYTNQGLTPGGYNKLNYDSVQFNDNGAWDVASGKYNCLRSGRVQFGCSLLVLNGNVGRNDYQLVVRFDNANDTSLARFQLDYTLVPAGELIGLSGGLMYPVEFGWKLYPELFVGGNGAGSSIIGNSSVVYNQFHCYYVD